MKIKIGKKDYRAIRAALAGRIGWIPTDLELWNAFEADFGIVELALTSEEGWADEAVVERLVKALMW